MVALSACVFSVGSPCSEECLLEGRKAHLYSLSFRSNGISKAGSSPFPGTERHRMLLKMESTRESSQNWSTEMSVSLKVGTHRTFLMMMRRHTPRWSRVRAGRSPMQVTFCGLPSMPVMVSLQGRELMKSLACG